MSKEELGKQTLALVCVYALLTCMLALDHIALYSIIYGNNSIQSLKNDISSISILVFAWE